MIAVSIQPKRERVLTRRWYFGLATIFATVLSSILPSFLPWSRRGVRPDDAKLRGETYARLTPGKKRGRPGRVSRADRNRPAPAAVAAGWNAERRPARACRH